MPSLADLPQSLTKVLSPEYSSLWCLKGMYVCVQVQKSLSSTPRWRAYRSSVLTLACSYIKYFMCVYVVLLLSFIHCCDSILNYTCTLVSICTLIHTGTLVLSPSLDCKLLQTQDLTNWCLGVCRGPTLCRPFVQWVCSLTKWRNECGFWLIEHWDWGKCLINHIKNVLHL